MRLSVSRVLLIVCALIAVTPRTANAAATPKVHSVAPLTVKIGDRLTVRGTGFLKGKNRNTVVFKAAGQRALFVKAESATAKRLVVRVPAKLAPFLKQVAGRPVATRFQLRVLARRLSAAYTPAGRSPVVEPAVATSVATPTGSTGGAAPAATPAPVTTAVRASDCDGDGTPDSVDLDDDNDLLPDTTEAAIATDTCNADTDGDGMEDGWEYQSAIDRNTGACPTGPYPTPCAAVLPSLTPTNYNNPRFQDAGVDYDGDVLTAGEEFAAWRRHGVRSLTDMWYSDGRQASQDDPANTTCRGLTPPAALIPTFGDAPETRWSLDRGPGDGPELGGVGCLTDDERDEDNDGLTNYDETHGPLTAGYWATFYAAEGTYPVAFRETNWLVQDTDGDGIADGNDDQDGDGFTNLEEAVRGTPWVADGQTGNPESGLWTQPFNPCLPNRWSAMCSRYIPGPTAWAPFVTAAGFKPSWPLYNAFNGFPEWDKKQSPFMTVPPLPSNESLLPKPT